MALLNEAEIHTALASLPGWGLEANYIVRLAAFHDFAAAIRFVNLIADEAERLGHHPDIDIRWNKVRIAISTHDAGGLTDLDFRLAASIQSVMGGFV